MNSVRLATAFVMSAALLIAGCDRKAETPPPPKQEGPAEGAPRIVTSADGVHIEYHLYGKAETALVLVHGWSADSSYWQKQIAPLKAKYTVVTLDLAGHGASAKNRTAWTMESYGEDVASVVRQIPNARVILVGHSMGGPVVLEAAPRIGDRVIGIVGVDTFKSIGQPPTPRAQLEKEIEPFRKDFIGQTRAFVTEHLFLKTADPQLVRKVADDMSLAPPDVAVPSLASLNELDLAPLVRELKVPIVAINSSLNPITDEARIRRTAPSFHATIMEDTGHFPMLEKPAVFTQLLLKEVDAIAESADASSTP